MKLLKETIAAIPSLDEYAMQQTQLRLDGLTKPPGRLGKLEEIAVQLAGITGQAFPKVDVARVVLFAADHGVVDEGVSAFPQDVTAQWFSTFLREEQQSMYLLVRLNPDSVSRYRMKKPLTTLI